MKMKKTRPRGSVPLASPLPRPLDLKLHFIITNFKLKVKIVAVWQNEVGGGALQKKKKYNDDVAMWTGLYLTSQEPMIDKNKRQHHLKWTRNW